MSEEVKEKIEKIDAKLSEPVNKVKSDVSVEGPLKWLCLAALPLGYFVSSIPGRYGTHAVFGMVALFIILSLTTPVQNGRYIGIMLAAVWAAAGVLFYSMRGI